MAKHMQECRVGPRQRELDRVRIDHRDTGQPIGLAGAQFVEARDHAEEAGPGLWVFGFTVRSMEYLMSPATSSRPL